MKNLEIAHAFDLIADLLELKGENPFRIRAYRRAAQNLEALTEDLTWPVDKLRAWARKTIKPGTRRVAAGAALASVLLLAL